MASYEFKKGLEKADYKKLLADAGLSPLLTITEYPSEIIGIAGALTVDQEKLLIAVMAQAGHTYIWKDGVSNPSTPDIWLYDLNGQAFQQALQSRGLPVLYVSPTGVIVCSRQLTQGEKNELAKWVAGKWSAFRLKTTAYDDVVYYVDEEKL